jgi:uncharacterized membrane protein YdjX (TVP38/TMEM64 family)
VREQLSARRGRTLAALLLFALSPIPSAQLFEAAGLTGVRLLPLVAAFFGGRIVSYSLYVGGAAALRQTNVGRLFESSLTNPWAVLLELLCIAGLLLLLRVDWASRLRTKAKV